MYNIVETVNHWYCGWLFDWILSIMPQPHVFTRLAPLSLVNKIIEWIMALMLYLAWNEVPSFESTYQWFNIYLMLRDTADCPCSVCVNALKLSQVSQLLSAFPSFPTASDEKLRDKQPTTVSVCSTYIDHSIVSRPLPYVQTPCVKILSEGVTKVLHAKYTVDNLRDIVGARLYCIK